VRGQLLHLSWHGPDCRHAWCGDLAATRCRGRTGRCLVGATVEEVGFDERRLSTASRR
jgi:hypothetical protein